MKPDANGKTLATIGVMRDDGTNGDAVAGDKVFSYRLTLTEPNTGQVFYRVSAAFKGVLARSQSNPVSISVWGTLTETLNNSDRLSLAYPPDWLASASDTSVVISNVQQLSPLSERALQTEAVFVINVLPNSNPENLTISQWFDQHFATGFPTDLIEKRALSVAGRPSIRIELTEIGRRVHIYVPNGVDVVEITYGLYASAFVSTYESILRSIQL